MRIARRRQTECALQLKVPAALEAGLVPILCVGETEEERERGDTERKLRHQVQEGLEKVPVARLPEVVLAYEPIWAIGTGRPATGAHASAAAQCPWQRWARRERPRAEDRELPVRLRGELCPAIDRSAAGRYGYPVSGSSEAFSQPSSDPRNIAARSCHDVPRFSRFEMFEMRRLGIHKEPRGNGKSRVLGRFRQPRDAKRPPEYAHQPTVPMRLYASPVGAGRLAAQESPLASV